MKYNDMAARMIPSFATAFTDINYSRNNKHEFFAEGVIVERQAGVSPFFQAYCWENNIRFNTAHLKNYRALGKVFLFPFYRPSGMNFSFLFNAREKEDIKIGVDFLKRPDVEKSSFLSIRSSFSENLPDREAYRLRILEQNIPELHQFAAKLFKNRAPVCRPMAAYWKISLPIVRMQKILRLRLR